MSVTEIARLAGVSQATVSKVINDYPSVSEENARKVRGVMEKLDYVPLASRRRTSMKFGLVAVLVLYENPHHYFSSVFALQLKGIEKTLREHGGDMLLANVSDVGDLPVCVRKRKVDGLILVGHKPSDIVLGQIRDIPSVWLTSHHEPNVDVTLAGNEDVGRLAAEYLIGRGHKNLGILNGLGTNPALEARFRYFVFIAGEHKCEVSRFVCDQTEFQGVGPELDLELLERQVDAQVDRLIHHKPRPTGLFVPFDIQVAMLYRVLSKRGVAIDKTLEIIGDTDEKRTFVGLLPRPATINIGPEVMGRHAVEQLLLRLRHGEASRRVRVSIEPKLVPGDDALQQGGADAR